MDRINRENKKSSLPFRETKSEMKFKSLSNYNTLHQRNQTISQNNDSIQFPKNVFNRNKFSCDYSQGVQDKIDNIRPYNSKAKNLKYLLELDYQPDMSSE